MSIPDGQLSANQFIHAELSGEGVGIAPEVVVLAGEKVSAMPLEESVPPPPGHKQRASELSKVASTVSKSNSANLSLKYKRLDHLRAKRQLTEKKGSSAVSLNSTEPS